MSEEFEKVFVSYPVPSEEVGRKIMLLSNSKLANDSLLIHESKARLDSTPQYFVVIETRDEIGSEHADSVRRIFNGISVEVAQEVRSDGS